MSQTSPFRNILIIFNPTAGARRRRKLEQFLDGLTALGCPYHLYCTTQPGDAEQAAAKAQSRGHDLVVAAGGDGTVNEVANGLAASRSLIPLAVLPLGTANVLAAEIGLRPRPQAVVEMIRHGHSRAIRLGLAGDRHFVLMASAGLDSVVVRGVDMALKRRTGQLAYGIEALRQAWRYRFPELTITVDGTPYPTRMAVICKARCYGGPFHAAPKADLGDDLLHAVLLKRGGLGAVLRYGAALVLGRLPFLSDVQVVAGRRMELHGPCELPVQADGDLVGNLPQSIRVSDRAIQLLIP